MFVRWQNGLCSRRVHRQNVKHQLDKRRSIRDYWYLGEFWDTRAARWNAEKQKSLCERISEEMAARGFLRTFKQCRNKIKWLKHDSVRAIVTLTLLYKLISLLIVCSKMSILFHLHIYGWHRSCFLHWIHKPILVSGCNCDGENTSMVDSHYAQAPKGSLLSYQERPIAATIRIGLEQPPTFELPELCDNSFDSKKLLLTNTHSWKHWG